ncbi:MAG TPA: acetate/propionate family kinase [Solirubrobacteraceae bacterium]|nr:acetate/propionate family kinase [Solirubrobacteraceae bacterium]
MAILAVNAGSSSLKLSLIADGDRILAERELDAPDAQVDADQLDAALGDGFGSIEAVAHRIVHGGQRFTGPVLIDDEVRRALEQLTDLAPLHQPKSLAALRAVSERLPDTPAVACFDTAFHQTLPPAAATYPLPARWRERWGLRRFGFHGLSHAWIARRVPELCPGLPGSARIVSCHLGAGASLCAIAGGASVDTTMGFTPLDGLVMATRSGSVDPGMLLWLLERERLTERELAESLEHESGLAGIAGTADMREILCRAGAGDAKARLALDVYIHRLRSLIAGMVAAMAGIDVLAFTGGVGERSGEVRSLAADGLGFLGVELDAGRNAAAASDAEIGQNGAPVRTLVVTAREDLEMARQARPLLLDSPTAR